MHWLIPLRYGKREYDLWNFHDQRTTDAFIEDLQKLGWRYYEFGWWRWGN